MLRGILHRAWSSPFTTRSVFAREHTDEIAQAACLGLISTHDPDSGQWGRTWRITAQGLLSLETPP
jgi:hypothetical protein